MPNRERATHVYMSATRVSNVLETVFSGRPASGAHFPETWLHVDMQLRAGLGGSLREAGSLRQHCELTPCCPLSAYLTGNQTCELRG